MTSLEEYLTGEYQLDTLDLTEIESNLSKAAATFAKVFQGGLWPYQYQTTSNDPIKISRISQGTQAMVLAATGRILGRCKISGCDRPNINDEIQGRLENTWDAAFDKLVESLKSRVKRKGVVRPKVRSSTFGDNNPITLSHLTELSQCLGQARQQKRHELVERYLAEAKTSLNLQLQEIGVFESSLLSDLPDEDSLYLPNAFVPLRALRAAIDLKIDWEKERPRFREFFESELHDQLSFSSIPDSRFDPAELLFCVEGLLLCAKSAVDPRLFTRVLGVLAEKQDTSAHWRPNKPFVASEKGNIILPLSVEGANSLLRSIAIMDEDRLHHTFTPEALPLIRRFWQWLRSRAVRFQKDGLDCVGWHSEHVNEPDLIHIWDTSQIVEFMLGYRTLLRRHIARETLVLSGAKVSLPTNERVGDWDYFERKFEPLIRSEVGERVYESVGRDFFEPWRNRTTNKKHSMLIYGPPGTGKTTIAESLAAALGFKLITITVSDFLGSGGALVEARAKAVFQMLEAQSDVVILFDEIDAFLLDRDSRFYRKQDTLFQFLTPGMLTKINDLRRAERSIFIIATNYENRIDAAIKRPGRIDQQYLLLPPALHRRAVIIAARLAEIDKPLPPKDVPEMARAALYLGYGEIRAAIRDSHKTEDSEEIVSALKDAPRSTSAKQYLSRILIESTFPEREFVGILRLAREAGELGAVLEDVQNLPKQQRSKLKRFVEASGTFRELLGSICQ